MKKITPNGNRVLLTSRGKRNDGDVYIPDHLLDDSDVCNTEDGKIVIRRRGAGHPVGEHRYIVDNDDIIASVEDGTIVPNEKWVYARKCADPETEGGIITSTSGNATQFAEVLAVGGKTGLDSAVGWLAYIRADATNMQKVEETDYDWLIEVSCIEMAVQPEE